jgi:hypothetical protein
MLKDPCGIVNPFSRNTGRRGRNTDWTTLKGNWKGRKIIV